MIAARSVTMHRPEQVPIGHRRQPTRAAVGNGHRTLHGGPLASHGTRWLAMNADGGQRVGTGLPAVVARPNCWTTPSSRASPLQALLPVAGSTSGRTESA